MSVTTNNPDAGDHRTARHNHQWAMSIVHTCLAFGCDHFFIAPGSRCTPLTLAIAQQPGARTMQHFDERGLAFACLGYVQATGRAGVFVCTSGTAAANAFPAVIEASQRHLPMLLLTADRPSELRGTGANQTIDQRRLYGHYARSFCDFACGDGPPTTAQVEAVIQTALDRRNPGPVQVNCMFREPLVSGGRESALLAGREPVVESDTRSTRQRAGPPGTLLDDDSSRVHGEAVVHQDGVRGGATLVLLGNCSTGEATAGQRVAERWGCPLLSDVTSGLRTSAYDLALTSGALPPPETVVHLGGQIVSKRLLRWLDRHIPRQWLHVWPYADRYDPVQRVTDRIVGDITTWIEAAELKTPVPKEYLRQWQRVDEAARKVAHRLGRIPLPRGSTLTEPAIASALAQRLPDHHGLWLGNSMPVREMDTFGFWGHDRRIRVGANRGASGIDGQVSAAVGFAWGLGDATTLVVGDLSLLHDLNALALLGRSIPPLILVVINNNGGGIFHFLPIATQTAHFEQYFGTPHGFDFRHAASMFGVPYEAPQTLERLCELHRNYLDAGQSVLIEVVTDRAANVTVHREIERQLLDLLET